MKRIAMILVAVIALMSAGLASAQRGGGGMHGGGSMGGGWSGGGSWNGGGWHGGGSWNGGGWNGGWHGGSWNGGWRGCWGCGGTRVVVGVGGPWWGWWPVWGWGPAWGGSPWWGWNAGPAWGGPAWGSSDSWTFVQRTDMGADTGQYQGEFQEAPQYQGAQVTSDGYAYYCPNPAGFYPQIASCSAGWLRVVPQGAPGPASPGQRY
jgi:hypothetical protein